MKCPWRIFFVPDLSAGNSSSYLQEILHRLFERML
jgi:hypothetical protein